MPPPDDLAPLLAWAGEQLDATVVRADEVQSLWSGYGSILRLTLEPDAAAKAPIPSVIVKHVRPPSAARHPRGWTGRASHERKLRSYEVERTFYSDWHPAPADNHRTARCYAAEALDGGFRFLLEDLDAAGYPERRSTLSDPELRACLRWLAAFHATHLGRAPDGLWPIGTYWHLATRQDELAAMKDDELRAAAPRLDALLRSCPHRTIVHGDAKVANFCFAPHRRTSNSPDLPTVAAVDLQYVGAGCGIQDVAYFLSSCLDDEQCEQHAERHLDTYFAALRNYLPATTDAADVERAWRDLYPAAWADFHRFLDGWAPGHWKMHGYTRRMTREALRNL